MTAMKILCRRVGKSLSVGLVLLSVVWRTEAQLQPRPKLHPASVVIARAGALVRISFSGTLEVATCVNGPWAPVTNALSPWSVEPAQTQLFYRAMEPVESIFSTPTVMDWVVIGPLQQHFDLAFAGTPDGIFPPKRQKPFFDATLVIPGFELAVTMRVRGNSSLQECPFPKLKVKIHPEQRVATPFADAREILVGTHCADGGRGNIGRLRDERAPFREALVYEAMDLLGFISPRVRRVRIDYRDTTSTNQSSQTGWQLTRHAVVVEDIEVVGERLGGRALDDKEIAALSKANFDAQLLAELQLFHALVGNWDFALSTDGVGLRNTDVLQFSSSKLVPVAGDFDLSSWVTGEVRLTSPRDYRPDLPELERQVRYQLEQIQGREGPERFTAAQERFRECRAAIESLIATADLDEPGRTNASRQLTAFFDGLSAVSPKPVL